MKVLQRALKDSWEVDRTAEHQANVCVEKEGRNWGQGLCNELAICIRRK